MVDVLLKTLPFFALIALGYGSGRTRFFTPEATAYLTKFVFYFALPAMLFKFAANLSMAEVFDGNLMLGYLFGTALVYGLATLVAMIRRLDIATTAVEAQCAVIGNVGFLGIPMFALLMGEASVGVIMVMLAIDLIVFSSLIVILITGSRNGGLNLAIFRVVGLGLLQNPMIVAISLGLIWSALALPIPAPANDFLTILSGASTPGALFAIGASLASKSAEKIEIAAWLSFCKLVLHPIMVAIGVLYLFPVGDYTAAVAISAAALPVAGNIYILAQHYQVAPQRVSAAILVSTVISVFTVSTVIAWVSTV